MSTSLCLYASQLASCIGHNRFKKPNDALELVWQRVAPDSYREALLRNNIKTQEEAIRDIISSNETVRNLLVHAEDSVTVTSVDVARGYEDVSQRLVDAQLSWEEHRLVDEAMKKTFYTSFGTRQEGIALQHIRGKIACTPDDTFYRRWVTDVDGVAVSIGGKIDAISEDGSTIIEIKNRINRLFFKIPLYEHIQVLSYLFAVPDATRAVLIECLTREDGSVLTHEVPIHWDEEFWSSMVVPKVRGFVKYLLAILRDPAQQDAYLQNPRKTALVTQWINKGADGFIDERTDS